MILFVRHGRTDQNVNKVFSGTTDCDLNELGITQAKEVAQVLKTYQIDVAFCSPLRRARQTLDEILKYHQGVPVVCDKRLLERSNGRLEGQVIDQRDDEARWNMANWSSRRYGESIKSAYARVKDFLDEINTKYAGQNVLIVSHYGIGRLVTCYFNGFPEDGNLKNIRIHNAELVEFDNSKTYNKSNIKM